MIVSVYHAPRGSGNSVYARRLADFLSCDYVNGATSIPNLRNLREVVIDEYYYYSSTLQEQLVTSTCRVHLVGAIVPQIMHPQLRHCLQTHFPEVFI